jgi:hypothetical protein
MPAEKTLTVELTINLDWRAVECMRMFPERLDQAVGEILAAGKPQVLAEIEARLRELGPMEAQ